jgi:hypothetical protein
MALDLASAATTHLNAVSPASRQAGSPFAQAWHHSAPEQSADLSSLPHSGILQQLFQLRHGRGP